MSENTPAVVAVDDSIGAVARAVYLCDLRLWEAGGEALDARFAEHLALLGIEALVLDPAVVAADTSGRVGRLSALLAESGIATYVADGPLDRDRTTPPPVPQLPQTVAALARGERGHVLGLDVALSPDLLATQVSPEGAAQVRDVARTLATATFLLPGPWVLRGGDEVGLSGPRAEVADDPHLLDKDLDSTRSITAHLRRVAAHRPPGDAAVTLVDAGDQASAEVVAYRVDPVGGRPYLVVANLGLEVETVELGPAGPGREGRAASAGIADGSTTAVLVTHEDTAVDGPGMRLGPWESRVYPL